MLFGASQVMRILKKCTTFWMNMGWIGLLSMENKHMATTFTLAEWAEKDATLEALRRALATAAEIIHLGPDEYDSTAEALRRLAMGAKPMSREELLYEGNVL